MHSSLDLLRFSTAERYSSWNHLFIIFISYISVWRVKCFQILYHLIYLSQDSQENQIDFRLFLQKIHLCYAEHQSGTSILYYGMLNLIQCSTI